MFTAKTSTIDWLLSGDPSIRWQVLKYLLNSDEKEIISERQKVETVGWGRNLLSKQDDDGKWSGRLYNLKWISTAYSMQLLMELGLLPNDNSYRGCKQLFAHGIYNDEEIRYSRGQKLRDNGITGMILEILSYFAYPDDRLRNLVEFLTKNQSEDGSWNYNAGAKEDNYRFDTTLLILKGLLEYRKTFPQESGKLLKAQKRGEEFLLRHYLYKQPNTNEAINKNWLLFSFPGYWHYDILNAMSYFYEADRKDPRLNDAIEVILIKQNKDATWNLQNRHPGKTYFEMEEVGKPSRWNTLRCLRILKWWDTRK